MDRVRIIADHLPVLKGRIGTVVQAGNGNVFLIHLDTGGYTACYPDEVVEVGAVEMFDTEKSNIEMSAAMPLEWLERNKQ